jgi:predicted dehydrogenase
VVDFLNAVVNGISIEPNLEDGVKAMKVLDTTLKSAASGRRVYLR